MEDVWRMYGGCMIVVDVELIDGHLHEEFMVRGGRMARVISICDLYLMEKRRYVSEVSEKCNFLSRSIT
jgi:hypothetical protein